jgi:hypothetical protein
MLVAERRDVLAPLLMRVAEWRNHKKFRRAGPSPLASSYDILEAPAVAGSYGLRLYVGATSESLEGGASASPKDVVEQFLALAKAAASGPDELRAIVGEDAYAKSFLRGFRELAPDGKAVGRVELGAMVRGRMTQAAALTPETRERLTLSLRRQDEEKPVTVDGVLKSVNLRGDAPKIGVDTDGSMRVFRIAMASTTTPSGRSSTGVCVSWACGASTSPGRPTTGRTTSCFLRSRSMARCPANRPGQVGDTTRCPRHRRSAAAWALRSMHRSASARRPSSSARSAGVRSPAAFSSSSSS